MCLIKRLILKDEHEDEEKNNKCDLEKCFGGFFFNFIAFRFGADKYEQISEKKISDKKHVTCDSVVLTEEYNFEVNKQKRCFPIVALVIVSDC